MLSQSISWPIEHTIEALVTWRVEGISSERPQATPIAWRMTAYHPKAQLVPLTSSQRWLAIAIDIPLWHLVMWTLQQWLIERSRLGTDADIHDAPDFRLLSLALTADLASVQFLNYRK